jgi:hypothetical protein
MTDPREYKMYLIEIHPHTGAFEDQDLIRIVETNWPEILSVHKLKGVTVEGSVPRSDKDVRKDRVAGLNPVTVTPGGDVLAPPGGGITTARTSVGNQMAADRAKRDARTLQKIVQQERPSIEERFEKYHNLAWEDLEIRLTSFAPSFAVTEIRTGETLGY